MTQEAAQAIAQKWWGLRGKATYTEHPIWGYTYKVGLTTLPARLGGYMFTTFSGSRLSFEDAFWKAYDMGHGPQDGSNPYED